MSAAACRCCHGKGFMFPPGKSFADVCWPCVETRERHAKIQKADAKQAERERLQKLALAGRVI